MRKYYKRTIKDTLLIKKIVTTDFFNWNYGYVSPQEEHDFWEFIYLRSGKVSYSFPNGKKGISLTQDQIFFLEPKTSHTITVDSQNNADIFFLCFECKSPIIDALGSYVRKTTQTDHFYLSKIIEEVINTFDLNSTEKLTPLPQARLGGEQCIQIYLELLIINILRNRSEKASPSLLFKKGNEKVEISGLVMQTLLDNIYSSLNIDEICKKINYSRSYISHQFKDSYGKSIIEVYNDLKIEAAKKMLISDQLTVAQISDKLNFTDLHYFNYVFKKYTKQTPTEYRNSIFRK